MIFGHLMSPRSKSIQLIWFRFYLGTYCSYITQISRLYIEVKLCLRGIKTLLRHFFLHFLHILPCDLEIVSLKSLNCIRYNLYMKSVSVENVKSVAVFLLRKIALPYPHKCLFGFVEQNTSTDKNF